MASTQKWADSSRAEQGHALSVGRAQAAAATNSGIGNNMSMTCK
jgi:hypothetical protein